MYWKPQPKRHGFAWWALLIPAIIYSIGVIVYAHNAFVPGLAGRNGHEIGSALMVFGGESGTLAAAAEVFRKARDKQTVPLDWFGLIVSLAATLGNLMVVYVSLAVHLQAPWVDPVRQWGPLVLLLCSGVDFYAGIMEFGFYNASFDARWTAWNDAKHSWEAAHNARAEKEQASIDAQASKTIEDQIKYGPHYAGVMLLADEAPEQEIEAQASISDFACSCGRSFKTRQALAAHSRFCKGE